MKSTSRVVATTALVLLLLVGATTSHLAAAEQKTIAMVTKDSFALYWLIMKTGAEDEAAKLGYRLVYKAPAVQDIAAQVNIVNDLVATKPAVLLLVATDSKALVPAVESAVKYGVPVVTVDSGVESQLPVAYVATNNFSAGEQAGEALAKVIGYRGSVAIINIQAGGQSLREREEGFKTAVAKYPDIKVVGVRYSGNDTAKSMDYALDFMTSHPDLAGFFGAADNCTYGAAKAVKERGLAGKVKIIGFDASPEEIDSLKAGLIQGLIVQSPYDMAALAVRYADKYLKGEKVPKTVDVPVALVTPDNFDLPEIQKALFPPVRK